MIRPNQSLSWHGALKFYAAISFACLGIGFVFVLRGFWPVLLFAGLEVAILGIAFYRCLARSQVREVISVDADVVRVEKGRQQAQEHWECPRAWARVSLEDSPLAWYPKRLAVATRGIQEPVVIGRFLNDEERGELAAELEQVIQHDDWQQDAG